MTATVRDIAKTIVRFIVVWLVDIISLIAASLLVPGFTLNSVGQYSPLVAAAATALMLGIINLVIRPIILLLARPFGWIILFVVGFLVNAIVLLIAARLIPGLVVDGILAAVVASVVIAIANVIVTELLSVNDDDSFYNGVIERLAKRQDSTTLQDGTRGLLILEVDGLSFHHISKAIADGRMPTLKKLIDERGYQLSHIDCGLPSQTSACQAGIMYGDNFDIPSFRWVDKEQGKLYVSGSAAAELDARFSRGQGLMRQGTSINNMLSGDASKSLLTFANLFATSNADEKRRRAEDIYLLMLNPYFFMRVIVLFIGDVLLELWEGWQQKRRDEQPRLDRLHKFYPFVRGATTVFMRDISAGLIALDIMRGVPVIYNTYCGYDEVAHHSGPWSKDAFRTLGQFDTMVARLLNVIERRGARDYELIVLSDHGQSFGATFEQRYHTSLKEYIESLMPEGTTVTHSSGGDDGAMSVASMAGELSNLQDEGMGGMVGKRVIGGTQRALNRAAVAREDSDKQAKEKLDDVVVCGSGNIAQAYFTNLSSQKVTLKQFNEAYPGVLDKLVRHEGIGFVVSYDDDGTPFVFGKGGGRNLHTGEVTGNDPLAPYGDPELRAMQLRRVADFPHSGDLIVNSTIFPDGTVAAMEELIGNHGGLGGEQTDAFILHPADMAVASTTNSADVFALLDARRGLPARAPAKQVAAPATADSWAWSTLVQGVKNVPAWLRVAAGAVALESSAYAQAASDPLMTGPAVVIVLVTALIVAIAWDQFTLSGVLSLVASFLVSVVVVHLAARVLGGKANLTQTFRAAAFARSTFVLGILAVFAPIAPLVRVVVTIMVFVATWLGVAQAHGVRGWKTLLLPLVAVVLVFVVAAVLAVLLSGAVLTIDNLMSLLGFTPPAVE
jgi:uncharacterized membrane protein YvlD (DUF360 family)